MPNIANFKDFYVQIGQPGAYSENMEYSKPIGLAAKYSCYIKHAPYSIMNKIKNVVTQTWKDEDGDDVWLPQVTGDTPGKYNPAVTHESSDYKITLVYFEKNFGNSNEINKKIMQLQRDLEGRWLRIYDTYTEIGYDGAYLVDVDDDPKFKRRTHDHVEFTLTFKINGRPTEDPFKQQQQ